MWLTPNLKSYIITATILQPLITVWYCKKQWLSRCPLLVGQRGRTGASAGCMMGVLALLPMVPPVSSHHVTTPQAPHSAAACCWEQLCLLNSSTYARNSSKHVGWFLWPWHCVRKLYFKIKKCLWLIVLKSRGYHSLVLNIVLIAPCKAKAIWEETQFKVWDIIFYALTSKGTFALFSILCGHYGNGRKQ